MTTRTSSLLALALSWTSIAGCGRTTADLDERDAGAPAATPDDTSSPEAGSEAGSTEPPRDTDAGTSPATPPVQVDGGPDGKPDAGSVHSPDAGLDCPIWTETSAHLRIVHYEAFDEQVRPWLAGRDDLSAPQLELLNGLCEVPGEAPDYVSCDVPYFELAVTDRDGTRREYVAEEVDCATDGVIPYGQVWGIADCLDDPQAELGEVPAQAGVVEPSQCATLTIIGRERPSAWAAVSVPPGERRVLFAHDWRGPHPRAALRLYDVSGTTLLNEAFPGEVLEISAPGEYLIELKHVSSEVYSDEVAFFVTR